MLSWAAVSSDWGDWSRATLLSAHCSGIFIPGWPRSVSAWLRTQDRLRTLKSPIRITQWLDCASRFEFLSRVTKLLHSALIMTVKYTIVCDYMSPYDIWEVYLRFKRGHDEFDSWETFFKRLRFPKTSLFISPLYFKHMIFNCINSIHFIKSKEDEIIQSDYFEFFLFCVGAEKCMCLNCFIR